MNKIKSLQILVYIAFGVLIVYNVLPDASRGFKDGFIDGYNLKHGVKTTKDLIPAVLSVKNSVDGQLKNLPAGKGYTLHNVRINADVEVNTGAGITWFGITGIVLVLFIALMLLLVAYHVNMVIVNIANGDIFETVCIYHIRRAGALLIVYCIADVIYQGIVYTELYSVINGPVHVVNTTVFNFPVLICAFLAFIIAEAFKQGAILKHEQDLTI